MNKEIVDKILEVKAQIDAIDLELRLLTLMKILEQKKKELHEGSSLGHFA